MLDHLTQEVRHAVVGANEFTASYGVVITWYMFRFDGASCSDHDCPVNNNNNNNNNKGHNKITKELTKD